jgi:hypothetical protein
MTMCDKPASFRIKYDIHCRFNNCFGKEVIVKNCLSELHAKIKLGDYCEKKYGREFEYIKFISVKKEGELGDLFNDNIFGKGFGQNLSFNEIFKNYKKKT